MKYTANLNLKKPDLTDYVNVEDFNENSDKLDTEIKALKVGSVAIGTLNTTAKTLQGAINELKAKDDSLSTQMADIGNKTLLKTTVKTDLVSALNELFTNASDGKTKIANALTAEGVSASSSETFTSLAGKIPLVGDYKVGDLIPVENLGLNIQTGNLFVPQFGMVDISSSSIITHEFIYKVGTSFSSGYIKINLVVLDHDLNVIKTAFDMHIPSHRGFTTGDHFIYYVGLRQDGKILIQTKQYKVVVDAETSSIISGDPYSSFSDKYLTRNKEKLFFTSGESIKVYDIDLNLLYSFSINLNNFTSFSITFARAHEDKIIIKYYGKNGLQHVHGYLLAKIDGTILKNYNFTMATTSNSTKIEIDENYIYEYRFPGKSLNLITIYDFNFVKIKELNVKYEIRDDIYIIDKDIYISNVDVTTYLKRVFKIDKLGNFLSESRFVDVRLDMLTGLNLVKKIDEKIILDAYHSSHVLTFNDKIKILK